MENKKIPKSELLRDWIDKQMENEVDLSTPYKRTQSFEEFLKQNTAWESEKSDIRYFYDIWKRQCRKKGIDLRSLGIKDPKVFTKNKSDSINPNITPKPKQIDGQPPTHEAPQQIQQGQPVQGKLLQTGQQQLTQIIEHSKEEVKELIKGTWYGLKIKWSEIEDLDDEELDILSGVLKPVCDRHMQGDISFYLVPLVVVFGVAGGKIRKARQIQKEKKAKEKQEKPKEEKKEDGQPQASD